MSYLFLIVSCNRVSACPILNTIFHIDLPRLMDTAKNLYDRVGGAYGEKHRHFSREFKRDAVQLVTEKGMPVGKVAESLIFIPIYFISGEGGS